MKLSIVSVHRNDFPGLERTLASLMSLPPSGEIQWVVVDGGSNVESAADLASLNRIRSLASSYVSEPDQGIYDAMNKGTSLAGGDYVLYLNAGDELHPDFDWKRLAEEIVPHNPAMVWGVCHERFADGTLVKVKNRSPGLAWYGMPVNHQNVLFKRDVLDAAPYDTSYRICADYDLVSRLLRSGGSVFRSHRPISIFQRGGISANRFEQNMAEEALLRTIHYGVPRPLSNLIRVLKTFNNRIGQTPAIRRWLRRWV